MIARLRGKLVDKGEHQVLLDVQGVCYEVLMPVSVRSRIDQSLDEQGQLLLVTYHYLQMTPSSAFPIIVGFLNELERDFFEEFIKVSGIGPRAAVKAINRPISEIAQAIDHADAPYLKTLPGIGAQRAKEIIAKLQGKVARFALIRDQQLPSPKEAPRSGFAEEALEVLLQLQYRKPEAAEMIQKAMERSREIQTAEELLNEIYKQRIKV